MEHFFFIPPPPNPLFFLLPRQGRKKKKKDIPEWAGDTSKISQGASKQMCGLHLGELVFVYCLFWISTLCPQIKLQEKGEPGRRPEMSLQLLMLWKEPWWKVKAVGWMTPIKKHMQHFWWLFAVESLFPESSILLEMARKGCPKGKAMSPASWESLNAETKVSVPICTWYERIPSCLAETTEARDRESARALSLLLSKIQPGWFLSNELINS